MSGTKSFATLTPTLLARKGGAKPAMRPQLHPLQKFHQDDTREWAEDLGWNDMGVAPFPDRPPHEGGAEIVPIAGDAKAGMRFRDLPDVVRQQAGLSSLVVAEAKPRRSALALGRRAAFTLRLDADRHLKLRLTSAVQNRSAQDILTEALDNHLATLADIESLAAKIRNGR
jgi:hypothetical protein